MFRSKIFSYSAPFLSLLTLPVLLASPEVKNQDSGSVFNKSNFTPFTVDSVDSVSHNTKSIRVKIDSGESANLPVASCVVVRAPFLVDGKEVIRPVWQFGLNWFM